MDSNARVRFERKCNALILRVARNSTKPHTEVEDRASLALIEALRLILKRGSEDHLITAQGAYEMLTGKSARPNNPKAALALCEEIQIEIGKVSLSVKSHYNLGAVLTTVSLFLGYMFVKTTPYVNQLVFPKLIVLDGDTFLLAMVFASLTSVAFSSATETVFPESRKPALISVVFKGVIQTFSTAFLGFLFAALTFLFVARFDGLDRHVALVDDFDGHIAMLQWFFLLCSCFGVWLYKVPIQWMIEIANSRSERKYYQFKSNLIKGKKPE